MRCAAGLLLGVCGALLAPAAACAVTLDPIGEFERPIFVTSEPSNPDRLLVVEQGGRIVVSEGGSTSVFLDLTAPEPDLLVSGGEQGLLSVALAPDYAQSGRLYVFYTRNGTGNQVGDLQIDEFTASGGSASIASRRPVLTIDHEQEDNHNGGQLQFGRDGYLYIATGDGGGAGDPFENAQNRTSLLGKILRIDPRPSGSAPYGIPPGNPFADGPGGFADEIWSYGLRNPWRFSFDRATGDLLVGDVGQAAWEEVDFDPSPRAGAGVNFGWDCREGRHEFEPAGCPPLSALTDPIHEYANPNPGGAAITGGYVVRDEALGDLYGRYLYVDVYGGPIRSLIPALPNAAGDRAEPLTVQTPVSFGEDSCGRVYVTSQPGPVYRLVGDTASVCPEVPPPPPGGPGARRATCAGKPATIAAQGPLVGTPGDDVIAGDGGADRIRGRGGADLICGKGGRDRLRGGGGADRLRGGPGRDRCRGGGGKDRKASC